MREQDRPGTVWKPNRLAAAAAIASGATACLALAEGKWLMAGCEFACFAVIVLTSSRRAIR